METVFQRKRLLRIATYNIHRCIGRDGIKDPNRIIDVLGEINADIIALQEVSSPIIYTSENPSKILISLTQKTGMDVIEGYTLTAAGARYGNAVLTRLPMSATKRFDISVKKREPRGVIEVTININGVKIFLWATHLGLGIRERHLQSRKIQEIVHQKNTDITILLGDFNEWLPWGRPLRILHRLFTTTPSPATFPSARPFLRLDRIWVRPADRLRSIRVHSTKLSRIASDHLPLVADIYI